jgi:tripartite motif-containing protein 2/3/tripartite motif-containing protein 71
VDFVEQNIENATEEELMSIHTQVMNRISQETKKHQFSRAELEPVEKANMIAEVKCAEELTNLCQEKTAVTLLKSTVDGAGTKEAKVDKPAYVQVSCNAINPILIESKLASPSESVQGIVKRKQKNVYEIKYVPKVRGRHKLEITANGLPVPGSPFPVFVKIPPTQLGKPVKIIGGVKKPIDIAINSAGELLVVEDGGDVIVIDERGKKVQSIQKVQYGFEKLYGISVDKDDNIYLIDQGCGKLFKFNQDFKLVKVFDVENACGIVVTKDQVVVGSRGHKTCYVLDQELNLEKTIALKTIGVGDIMGIAVDEHVNLYICDFGDGGIRVVSQKNQSELLYSFGQELLGHPHSVCISGGLVYISTWSGFIFVFTKDGTLVASFGSRGHGEGQFRFPSGLVFDADGYLYVCDSWNNRLQLF